jgi:hypothetical protein
VRAAGGSEADALARLGQAERAVLSRMAGDAAGLIGPGAGR